MYVVLSAVMSYIKESSLQPSADWVLMTEAVNHEHLMLRVVTYDQKSVSATVLTFMMVLAVFTTLLIY